MLFLVDRAIFGCVKILCADTITLPWIVSGNICVRWSESGDTLSNVTLFYMPFRRLSVFSMEHIWLSMVQYF